MFIIIVTEQMVWKYVHCSMSIMHCSLLLLLLVPWGVCGLVGEEIWQYGSRKDFAKKVLLTPTFEKKYLGKMLPLNWHFSVKKIGCPYQNQSYTWAFLRKWGMQCA